MLAIKGGPNMRKMVIFALVIFLCVSPLTFSLKAPLVTCIAPPSGMVSWWPGDGNANDIIGNNNGTLYGGPTFTYITGMVGMAFSLDGTYDYVEVPDSSSLDITDSITIDAWIYAHALGGRVVDKITAGGSNGYMLDTYNSHLRFIIDGVIVSGSTTLTTNTWYHIAGVYNRSEQKLRVYVNGAQDGFGNYSGSIPANNLTIRIGADSTGANAFNGIIDEVEIFNRALSQSEIADIYAAGSAGKCRPQIVMPKAATKSPSLLPIASTNIAKANNLLTQADKLLSDAKAKNVDTASCEKLIDEANALLKEAKLRKTSPITANYFAIKAIEKFTQGIDCLKALAG